MADKQVMIADGHHRYETMVGLRDELRPSGAAPGTSLADWGPLFFARAEDPGLLVLPTHRLVRNLAPEVLGVTGSLRTKAASLVHRGGGHRDDGRGHRGPAGSARVASGSPWLCARPAGQGPPGWGCARTRTSARWGRPRCAGWT